MKNSLQKILTILIIFLLTVSPILAQESQVIIVNTNSPSAPIVTATNGIAIKSITSDGALIDDSYWADDLAAQSFLIREKSKKMADSLFKSDQFNNLTSAILLGYSQGGLRVRSMAQYIVQQYPSQYSKIKGIILVDSPNSGAPLATMFNSRGLLSHLALIITNTLSAIPFVGSSLAIIFGVLTLSYDESGGFEKDLLNIERYTEDNLPDFITKNKEKIIRDLENINDEKGYILFSNVDGILSILRNALANSGTDVNWFFNILAGAVESNAVVGAKPENVREITKEMRPGSDFLYELNVTNIKYELNFRRAALIGKNGNLCNLKKVRDISNQISQVHQSIYASYIANAMRYARKFWTVPISLYYMYLATKVAISKNNWLNLPKTYSFWATNGKVNSNCKSLLDSHDLLIPVDYQRLRYPLQDNDPLEPPVTKLTKNDWDYEMPHVNHIVPGSGVGDLIPELQTIANYEITSALKTATDFCGKDLE